ncbi:S-layer homology domain-containing protein [Gracilibacillus oryzae]|uniref:S-layer homology domain-containing protein n=1 Tax=Gracilibacillus oryzae TaxID=1672701 RepID=A0A7C8KWP6_9BACI|nr:S-layer homology domain-containing protein [Gracilibacillus oryzae]
MTGEEWFANSLYALAETDIIAGFTDGTFRPTSKVTRAELAAILGRAVDYAEVNAVENKKTVDQFTDAAQIPQWAIADIQTVIQHDIMQGFPNNSFAAEEQTTRAQAVTAIHNLLTKINLK